MMGLGRRTEVNYHGGHQLDIHTFNDYEVRQALDPTYGEWSRWAIRRRPGGAIGIQIPVISLNNRTEEVWMATYLMARAYAHLGPSKVGRPERVEYLERALDFCRSGFFAHQECRVTKLYHDFLLMLTTNKPCYLIDIPVAERREVSYKVGTTGLPDYEDLAKFIDLLLCMPEATNYCSAAYIPHLKLDHRVVSSYEYASFSSIVFENEADAVLCEVAE